MIKSVMFRLRVTRLNFPIIYYLFVLLFAVFGVVVVVVFFFSIPELFENTLQSPTIVPKILLPSNSDNS